MKSRISDLLAGHCPCSAEFIADVLQWPLAEVKAELAKMERRGEVESRTTVTYRTTGEGEAKCA